MAKVKLDPDTIRDLKEKANDLLQKKYSVKLICKELGIDKNIFYHHLKLNGVLRPVNKLFINKKPSITKIKEENKPLNSNVIDTLFKNENKKSKTILIITDDVDLIDAVLRRYE